MQTALARLAPWCLLIFALPAGAQEVRTRLDVDYLGPDRKEKADLYLPADDDPALRFPGVVIIHGGGWTGGQKNAAREKNIGTTLAQAGYVCMSIDYELAKADPPDLPSRLKSIWPRNLYDCKTAVRWLRAHAAELRLDADHIGVIGGSAGGHMAAMVALSGPDDGLDPPGPYGEFSSRVQAAVPMYGPGDLVARLKDNGMAETAAPEVLELCRQASPVTYASKDDPPCLILHGTKDVLVPVSQSQLLSSALEKAGVAQQLVIIEGAPHSFHLQPAQRDLRPLVIGFFDKNLKGK